MKGAFKNEEHIKTSMHGISRVGNSNHYPAGDNGSCSGKNNTGQNLMSVSVS